MSVFFFKENPFIKIAIPFIIGILLQYFCAISLNVLLFLFGIGLCSFFIGINLKISIRKNEQSSQIILFVLLILLGCLVYTLKSPQPIKYSKQAVFYEALLTNPLNEKQHTFNGTVNIKKIYFEDSIIETSEKVLITLLKDSVNFDFDPMKKYRLGFNKKPQTISFSNNIGAFNYSSFQQHHQVFSSVFLSFKDLVILDSTPQPLFQQLILKTQKWVIKTIQSHFTKKFYYGFLEALLIGYKNDLEKTFLTEYLLSGTVHIIAISGLHLGFLYWVMSSLILKRFNKTKTQKLIKAMSICWVLFFYAILAGFSPSILRAGIMFGIIAIGKSLDKETSMLNLLSFSAFLILVFNPHALFDLGFILSYGSITSLFVFYPVLKPFFITKNYFLNFFFSLIATTLAAQILIFPILVFNSYYFPTYFVLNNLIAIPLSTLILIFVLLLLFFSWASFISLILSQSLSFLIFCLHQSMIISNSMPYSMIHFPNYNGLKLSLYFVGIIFIVIYITTKKKIYFFAILISSTLLSVYSLYEAYKTQNQQYFTLYQHPKKEIIEIVNGKSSVIYHNDSLTTNDYQNYIIPAHLKLGVQRNYTQFINSNFVHHFGNYKICYLSDFAKLKDTLYNFDYLILNKNSIRYFDQIQKKFKVKKYILDNSCNLFHLGFLKKYEFLKSKIHSVKTDGAFLLKYDK